MKNCCIILIMRIVKQLLYGLAYLLILGGIAWGIYSIAVKPAPTCFDGKQNQDETGIDCGGSCVSCEIKNLKPLFVSPAILFSADRMYSASAEARNLNIKFGAESFGYEVNFYDGAGKLLQSAKRKSFIYAGETKNLIEAGAQIAAGIPAKAEFKIVDAESVAWKDRAEFSPPPYELKGANAVFENNQIAVSGDIQNLNNFKISRAGISAFLVDKMGVKIGASKTELRDIGPFRAESFKIFIPIKKSLQDFVDLEATEIQVEVIK